MSKRINLLIAIGVLIAISSIVIAANIVVQINNEISLEDVKDCSSEFWNETVYTYGNCTLEYNTTTCSDEPINSSCTIEKKSRTYTCITDETQVQNTRENCKDKSFDVEINSVQHQANYTLEYGEWGKCSSINLNTSAVIVCDSNLDGNADGICQMGESCITFIANDYGITRLMKNSRTDYVSDDETFLQEVLEMRLRT